MNNKPTVEDAVDGIVGQRTRQELRICMAESEGRRQSLRLGLLEARVARLEKSDHFHDAVDILLGLALAADGVAGLLT